MVIRRNGVSHSPDQWYIFSYDLLILIFSNRGKKHEWEDLNKASKNENDYIEEPTSLKSDLLQASNKFEDKKVNPGNKS